MMINIFEIDFITLLTPFVETFSIQEYTFYVSKYYKEIYPYKFELNYLYISKFLILIKQNI